ncbi:YobI family P-loop NTPase [Brucella pseudogrignonensis]
MYFFQSTDYEIVIIEDLDRFENPDVFVTLREINGLINANKAIKRRVRFLYALRDDIFANTDRTKFFEFIVPIVPIINHSNSIDKVLEQGERIDLHKRLNKQFIREVSRYLTDLRLIRNIFNEYVVYSVNLKADGEGLLDPNKLLAVLIYKNVIPKDFAALHRQEGVLSGVLARYED